MLNTIASRFGRWPTFALSILAGLVLTAMGIAVFLITIMAWGGGDVLVPVSVFAGILMVLGVGIMLRTGWWVDRAG